MKYKLLSPLFATALIAVGANASATEGYADRTAKKSEFQSHVEKTSERDREAREP